MSLMSLSADRADPQHAHSTAQVVRIMKLSEHNLKIDLPEGDHKDGGCKGDGGDDGEMAKAVGESNVSLCGHGTLTLSRYSSSSQNHQVAEHNLKISLPFGILVCCIK